MWPQAGGEEPEAKTGSFFSRFLMQRALQLTFVGVRPLTAAAEPFEAVVWSSSQRAANFFVTKFRDSHKRPSAKKTELLQNSARRNIYQQDPGARVEKPARRAASF